MLLLPTARASTVIAVTVDDLAWQAGEATSVGEIAESRWCAPDRLPEGTTGGTRQRIEDFYAGREAGPHWLDKR